MPSSAVIGGRRTRRPGVGGRIDATSLTRRSPGPKRLVLIGEAKGGKPVGQLTDGKPTLHSASTPDRVRALFAAGALRRAGLLAFDASRDPDIPSGPAELLLAKVNPATRGTLTLGNAGGDALVLTARDWGEHTNQLGVSIRPGSTKGLAPSVLYDDVEESGDDIGGDAVFSARYGSAQDASVMIANIGPAGTQVLFTRLQSAAPVTAAHNSGDVVTVLSDDTYDFGQKVTVYGVDATNAPVSETLVLAGTSPVTGTQAFAAVTAVRIDAVTSGAIIVRDQQGVPNIAFTIAGTLTAEHTSGKAVEVIGADADDVGIPVVVYGTDTLGMPQQETVVTNGATAVAGNKLFGRIFRAQLGWAAEGNVIVREESAGPTAFTIATGTLAVGFDVGAGVFIPKTLPIEGVLAAVMSAAPAGTPSIVVRGRSSAGVITAERLLVTAVPASTTTKWSEITHIELGLTEAGKTLSLTGVALDCPIASHPTVRSVVDAIDRRPGFSATDRRGDGGVFAQDRLDHRIVDITGANDTDFTADLDALVGWFTNHSTLVEAARASGATGAPDATATRQFLVGGAEGTTAASHWQKAFDALRTKRDVIVVPLTTDAAIHAMAVAHNRLMETKGNARNAYVGLSASRTKTQLASDIRTLGDRNTCAVAQSFEAYDEHGARTSFGPEYLAVVAGAMQAGSSVAMPLTRKTLNALSLGGHTSWSPDDDAESMLEAGLMFAREDERLGFVWERSITTYRADDNPVYSEMSANESANTLYNRLVDTLETQVGQKAFDGRASTLRSLTLAELEDAVGDGDIKAFDPESVVVEDQGDTFVVELEAAVIEPTNFILVRPHIRRISARAAV